MAMQVLNKAKELILILLLICCGLLLTSMYVFHGSRLSTWMLSSNINPPRSQETTEYTSTRDTLTGLLDGNITVNRGNADIRTNAQSAETKKFNKEGKSLRDSRLQKSTLNDSKLQKSTLNDSRLQESTLNYSRLQESTLNDSRLQESTLSDYRLQESTLNDSRSQESTLNDSRLQESTLNDSRLQESTLNDSRLQKSTPNDSKLQELQFNDPSIDINNVSIYTNLQMLVNILEQKLKAITIKRIENYRPTCDNDFTLANSCDNNTCLQTDLPENLTIRVTQLVTPRHLQMSQKEHDILREMADKVNGSYDIILLTAASSNHFLESQALLKTLHENVYPDLKNFTLIFYNLGLTKQERKLMVKYCRCQVVDFPFYKFSGFVTNLKCYSWKPVLIKANLQKANLVFWMDSSVRFNGTSALYKFLQGAKERGIQTGGSMPYSVFRTSRSMYHFFGDEPCAYLKLGQAIATLGVYHQEYFVDRVILEPWVACALNEDCMCPRNSAILDCSESNNLANRYYEGKDWIVYGLCHRFDQSAISLILHKLYQDLYQWVLISIGSGLSIERSYKGRYFPLV